MRPVLSESVAKIARHFIDASRSPLPIFGQRLMKEAGNRRPLEDADHALDVAFVIVKLHGDAHTEKTFLLGCWARSCKLE